MSDFNKKWPTVEKACEGLLLKLKTRAPTANVQIQVDPALLEHIRFALKIVDSTVNLQHENSHRMLVDPVVNGAAYALKQVFLWAEYSIDAQISMIQKDEVQEVFVNGFVDYLASRAAQIGEDAVTLLPRGRAIPQKPYCLVIEVKRGTELQGGFGQVLVEMKVVLAATKQRIVNAIYTDGNDYYFLRLEGDELNMAGPFYRSTNLSNILKLTQIALSGESFWLEEPATQTNVMEQLVRLPNGSTQLITTYPPGSTPPRLRAKTASFLTLTATSTSTSTATATSTSTSTSTATATATSTLTSTATAAQTTSLAAPSNPNAPPLAPASRSKPKPKIGPIVINISKLAPAPVVAANEGNAGNVASMSPRSLPYAPSPTLPTHASSSIGYPRSPRASDEEVATVISQMVLSNETGDTSRQGSPTAKRTIPRTPMSGPRKRRAVSAPPNSPTIAPTVSVTNSPPRRASSRTS